VTAGAGPPALTEQQQLQQQQLQQQQQQQQQLEDQQLQQQRGDLVPPAGSHASAGRQPQAAPDHQHQPLVATSPKVTSLAGYLARARAASGNPRVPGPEAGPDQQQQQRREQQQQEQQLQQQQQEHQLQQQQQDQQLLQQQLLQQGNIVINAPSPDPELIAINTLTGLAVTNPVTLNLAGYHAWAATNLVVPTGASVTPGNQQQHHQDRAVAPTLVANRVRLLNARTSSDGSSPPAGQDMAALSCGLPTEPPANTEVWADAPPVTSELGESPPLPPAFYLQNANHDLSPSSSGSSGAANRTLIKANTSTTGSTKVDDLDFELGDTDMEQEQESDTEIYGLALEDNEMAVDDPA
jgi:hypothetical protein